VTGKEAESEPMGMHAFEEFFGDGMSGGGADDGVNSALGAQRCLFLIDPLADLGGRKNRHAVEASACFTLFKFDPMITAKIVSDHVIVIPSKPRQKTHGIALLEILL
jgi:hypothetical protein